METLRTEAVQPSWYVLKTGEGPEHMVWLHGWGQTHKSLLRLVGLFQKDAHHHVFDLPGFGNTPKLPGDADTDDYAKALAQQLADIERPVILVGHSFGGRVAIRFAARFPDRVHAVVLIAGAGIPKRRSPVFRLKAFLLKGLGRIAGLLDRLFGSHFKTAYQKRFGSSDYRNAGELRGTFVKAVRENLSQTAHRVKAPTLLIYGSLDTETPPEIGHAYAKSVPLSRLEILPGLGHLDILERGAYQCEAMIRPFFKDTGWESANS